MITKYVRSNHPIEIPVICYSYFGSGSGSVSVTKSDGITVAATHRYRKNGFIEWEYAMATLRPGAEILVEESYYPGGSKSTRYVADHNKWREQRRNELAREFERRASIARSKRAFEDRERLIVESIREATECSLRFVIAAETTKSGRSGGRARRRAHKLRVEAGRMRQLAAARMSTWCVEIAHRCNIGGCDLNTPKIRWELRGRENHPWYAKLPSECEQAMKWLTHRH
jgi:hypothetical protein